MEQKLTTEAQNELYAKLCAAIDRAAPGEELAARTNDILQLLLSCQEDEFLRAKTLTQVSAYFKLQADHPQADQMLRQFVKKVVHLLVSRVMVEMKEEPVPDRSESPFPAAVEDRSDDEDESLLDRPTDVIVVLPPQPKERCEDFRDLLSEAICTRVAGVTTFFQRHNPRLERTLPRPFVLSPDFATRLDEAIRTVIVPTMMRARPIAMIAEKRPWSVVQPKDFWKTLTEDEVRVIHRVWQNTWMTAADPTSAHAGAKTKKPGDAGKKAGASRSLSKTLAPRPDDKAPYLLSRLTADELSLFASFLHDLDRDQLEIAWTPLRQLYEQEMDRRIYQDRARFGAFRDRLLEILEQLPPRLGELMAVLCYYNFRRMSLSFLRQFVRNIGVNELEWRAKMPQLMFFLEQNGTDELERIEHLAEERRLRLAEERRRRQIELEAATLPEGAVGWRSFPS